MTGTADEAWNETIAVLRAQGAMGESLDPTAIDPSRERPRFDRAAGTIDLVYDDNVYYGEGAVFLQLDVRRPEEARERSVRMWVDYPVGNKVVRYGRSIDDAATDGFHRAFVAARSALAAARGMSADSPEQSSPAQTSPEQGEGESTP